MNSEFDSDWLDLENVSASENVSLQKMVCTELLYRTYIGASGCPACRFISIEIPKEEESEFDSFSIPQGFVLSVSDPSVKHDGYVSCRLQAASSGQNDVFTVVAKDILNELSSQRLRSSYVKTLKDRIEKWKNFFRNSSGNVLNDDVVIGLFGELSFILDLKKMSIDDISDYWNGPVRSAQDFQSNIVAIEVKTISSKKIRSVIISSEEQLDPEHRQALFLVVYHIEKNDIDGITLPELISSVKNVLTKRQASTFDAKLICLGYNERDSEKYSKKYTVKESKAYIVGENFPRLLRKDMPCGISKIKYELDLDQCNEYEINIRDIAEKIREFEYGEERRTRSILQGFESGNH